MTPANRISVALCTYNGQQFLGEQLASIAGQTRLPDELVVCDDRSHDSTLAIIRGFAASAPFPVKVFENEQNLGYAANFEKAVRICNGNLIALSDQDDVWYPHRLEHSEQEFNQNAHTGLIFSDADIMDEQGRLTGETLWQRLGFAGKRKEQLLSGNYVILARNRFVTGATVMFRTALRERVLPVGIGWVHDEWIAMIAAAISDLKPIDKPLIRYRIHTSQQVGLQNKFERRATTATRSEKHWERLAASAAELEQLCAVLAAAGANQKAEVLAAYCEHLEFLLFRSRLPARRLARLRAILSQHSGYQRHASGPSSMLKDLTVDR